MGFLSRLNELFKPSQEYGIPSVTLTGQHVRSKGERVIADYFTRHSITYNYEAIATTNDWFIFKSKISRPDFYLTQYNLFVEYWGLVDSPDPRTRDNYSCECGPEEKDNLS
jgi:DNA helicase-4